MHKYRLFRDYLIYRNIRTLHQAKTYTKILAPCQIKTTSRIINLITRLVHILHNRKIVAMAETKMI